MSNGNSFAVVVDIDGNIVHSSDQSVTSQRNGLGICDVRFPRNVNAFIRQATLGAADDSDQEAGMITTELGAMGNSRIVRVRTFNMAGAAADRPFHLDVRSAG